MRTRLDEQIEEAKCDIQCIESCLAQELTLEDWLETQRQILRILESNKDKGLKS